MVFDCRPQLLPKVSGTELAEIRSMTRARVATAAPPKREQSFGGGGGGGDLLGSICPELGVAPLVDPGTNCEDELLIPAGPPAEVGHEMDSEHEKVFIDVVSLPTTDDAVSRVQCLHVLPGLLPGGAYVSREAKLNYITVTETEQCCYIP